MDAQTVLTALRGIDTGVPPYSNITLQCLFAIFSEESENLAEVNRTRAERHQRRQNRLAREREEEEEEKAERGVAEAADPDTIRPQTTANKKVKSTKKRGTKDTKDSGDDAGGRTSPPGRTASASKTKKVKAVTKGGEKKRKRVAASSAEDDVEPPAKYPYQINMYSCSKEHADELRELYDFTMESVLAHYDRDRDYTMVLYFAHIRSRASRLLAGYLQSRVDIRRMQDRRVLTWQRRDDASAPAPPTTLPCAPHTSADGGNTIDGDAPGNSVEEEEEEEDVDVDVDVEVDVGAREEAADADAAAAAAAAQPHALSATPDLAEYEDDLNSLLRSIAGQAVAVVADRMLTMCYVTRAHMDYFNAMVNSPTQPQDVVEVYAAAREQQLIAFRRCWLTTNGTLGRFFKVVHDAVARGEFPSEDSLVGGGEECTADRKTAAAADKAIAELRDARLPWTGTQLAALLRELPPAATTRTTTTTAGVKTTKGKGKDKAGRRVAAPAVDNVEWMIPTPGVSIAPTEPLAALIAPGATMAEVRCFMTWTLCRLTEATADSPAPEEEEKGEEEEDEEEGEDALALRDPAAGVLTILLVNGRLVTLRCVNPVTLGLEDIRAVSYILCDMCNTRIVAGFEAFLPTETRDNRHHTNSAAATGYDVCLPCALHVYRQAMMRMAAALHPDPRVRRPFAFGPGARIAIRAARAGRHADGSGDTVVHVEVGVAPYAARPVAWAVPPAAHAAMAAAFPAGRGGDGALAGLELSEARRRALPVPPPPPAAALAVTSVSTLYDDGDGDERPEECPVCLQSLTGEGPAIRTKCGHWFHLACLDAFYDGRGGVGDDAGDGDGAAAAAAAASTRGSLGCPLCRCPDFMPVLEESVVLARNVYRLVLRLPAGSDAVDAATGEVAVAVAALLSSDGHYHNPTNVAACQLLHVKLVEAPSARSPAHASGGTSEVNTRPPLRLPVLRNRSSARL